MRFNRHAIRTALTAYKAAHKQHDAILADDEVQGHYRREQDAEAGALIAERYPLGNWPIVQQRGQKLIEVMINGIPQIADLAPEDVWANVTAFKKFVALAEQV